MKLSSFDVYNSSYLTGEDIGSQPKVFTISAIDEREFDGVSKAVVSFHETDKQLILNKSQANSLVNIFGDETNYMLNQPVLLAGHKLTNGRFAGKWTINIYEAPTQPPTQPPAPQAPPRPPHGPAPTGMSGADFFAGMPTE